MIPGVQYWHNREYCSATESTVLVTLLISDTNSTAYPTLIYGLYDTCLMVQELGL